MEWIFLLLLLGAVLFGPPFLIGYAIGHHQGRKKERQEQPVPDWASRSEQARPGTQRRGLDPSKMHPAARPQPQQSRTEEPAKNAEVPLWLPADQQPAKQTSPWESEPTAAAVSAEPPAKSAKPQRPAPQPYRPAPQPPPKKPRRPRTPADEHRSINISLYVGGLVLTTAALAFVAAVQNPVLTATSLLMAYLLFAGTGLYLATKVAILKPAGYAIFGTSLALLAVAAIPVNEAFIGNGLITWAVVSAIGLVIYGFASVHLDSRVLGYLVIPFLYSSIFGSTASLQAPLVWTLVGIMVLSTCVQLAVILLGKRVPEVLRAPFGQLHWVVVPGLVIAAVLLAGQMRSLDYTVLFTATALYYAISAVRPLSAVHRPVLGFAARAAATAAVLSTLVYFRAELVEVLAVLGAWFGGWAVLVALFPQASGLLRGQKLPAGLNWEQLRRADLGAHLGLALAAALGVQALLLLPGTPLGSADWLWLSLAALIVLSLVLFALFRLSGKGTGEDKQLLYGGIRAVLAAAALIALSQHPWFALGWMVLWSGLEITLSAQPMRALIHRGQAVAALGVTGWLIGRLADDQMLGARLALMGIAAGAAATVTVLSLRRSKCRVNDEGGVYWLLSTVGFTAGTIAFGLTGIAQPFYAIAATAVVYTTAVLLLRHVQDDNPEDAFFIVRGLSFLAGAAIAALSIDWSAAWALAPGAADPAPTYAQLILLSFAGAELLSAAALATGRLGRALPAQPTAVLRAPELWPGTHLAVHGLWAGLVNLAVFWSAPVLQDDAALLWWFTAPAWAVAAFAGAAALHRTDRQAHPLPARRAQPRVYGALAAALGLIVLLVGTGAWWADAAVAAGLLLLAATAFGPARQLPEALPTGLATGAVGSYLLLQMLIDLIVTAQVDYPLAGQLAAGLTVIVCITAALAVIRTTESSREQSGLLTAAVLVFFFVFAHVLSLPGSAASAGEPAAQAGLAALGVLCLHLLLHRAAALPFPTAVRLGVFAAAVALCLMAVNWPAVVQAGQPLLLDALHVTSAGWALALAVLVFAAELFSTRRLSPGPAHRWIPLHLAANALWLSLINLVMLLAGIAGDLWWFTAVPWAAASVIFLRGAALQAPAGQPLPTRDLYPARGYAAGVTVLLVAALANSTVWWVQATVAAAALTVGIGALIWGVRLPEAPFTAPGFLAVGGAVFLAVTAAQLLSDVQLWGTPGGHPAVLGYLTGTGVFALLAAVVLAARRIWPAGRARRSLLLTSGATAALASVVPVITAQQHAAAPLAWSVPAMHLVLAAALWRIRRVRPAAALLGPVILPGSGLFAYTMAVTPTATALSVTLLLVLTAVLAAEAWLQPRTDEEELTSWQHGHWLTAGILTVVLSGLALVSDAAAVQFIALGGASLLLVTGLLRGVKLGVYWGAAVIVVSVLWALRGIMFLFLTVLGALIIGAAIWRLVLVQRKQAANDAAGSTNAL
ncbi:hypothetical protein [Nesterenkonia ebinurensis]|uniref:hypothetical protein n=1 Tax=Nesterenkonia ebinurensis TaxID=2608252 RepID=UPI00123E3FDD|nr:hypothetical protein [Nesterenkonia ebinurensis]